MTLQKMKKIRRSDSEKEITKKDHSKDIKYQILKGDIDSINFEKTYNRLKNMLSLQVQRADYDKLLELIDSVSENARVSGNMFVGAKEAYENFKSVEYAVWWSRASNEATRILEKMKRNKIISGQISEEKIRNWVIENRTDKYVEMTEKLNRYKTSVDAMKILYEQWESRKSLLQTQANVIEKRKVVMINNK